MDAKYIGRIYETIPARDSDSPQTIIVREDQKPPASPGPVERLVVYRTALELIAEFGCMQSSAEEEYWCKHDGSAHSIYCPAGIARIALEQEGI